MEKRVGSSHILSLASTVRTVPVAHCCVLSATSVHCIGPGQMNPAERLRDVISCSHGLILGRGWHSRGQSMPGHALPLMLASLPAIAQSGTIADRKGPYDLPMLRVLLRLCIDTSLRPSSTAIASHSHPGPSTCTFIAAKSGALCA